MDPKAEAQLSVIPLVSRAQHWHLTAFTEEFEPTAEDNLETSYPACQADFLPELAQGPNGLSLWWPYVLKVAALQVIQTH